MEKEIKEDIMLYLNNIKLDDKLLEPEIYEDMIKKLNSRTPKSSLFMTVQHYYDIKKVGSIQSTLHLEFGNFFDEFPEQLMSAKFIDLGAKVMELGGNIGRNSCFISKILNDDTHLVVLEPHPEIYKQLVINKNKNYLHFNTECCALSKKRMIQCNWDTKEIEKDEKIPDGHFEVKIISFDELEAKYSITFQYFCS